MNQIIPITSPLFLVLGSGKAANACISSLRQHFPSYQIVQISQESPSKLLSQEDVFIDYNPLSAAQLIDKLKSMGSPKAVVNRFDSYIPLAGKLVDAFGLPGASYASTKIFKNKGRFAEFCQQHGLEDYRPWSVVLQDINHLDEIDLPSSDLIVKPLHGSKSRGIFVLKQENLENLSLQHQKLLLQKKYQRANDEQLSQILIEEVVRGKQFTFTGYVDSEGTFNLLSTEDVVTCQELGMSNWQLAIRSLPAERIPKEIIYQAESLIQKLVTVSGLKTTFLYPEFILTSEGSLKIIEVNVRIGGFRTEMLSAAAGIDLNLWAIRLALGEHIDTRFEYHQSVAMIEFWSDFVGVVVDASGLKTEAFVLFTQNVQIGGLYTPPPQADIPIATGLITQPKAALAKALSLYKVFTSDFAPK